MSGGYGFLTQSTIIPKRSKQIALNDNSGQVALELLIQKQKQKLKNKQESSVKLKKQIKRNTGIEERIKRDECQDNKVKLTQKNYYKILQKKSEVYGKVENKKVNIDKLLVDFQSKQDAKNKMAEQQEYQKARQAFYKGQIKKIEKQQDELHENVDGEKYGTSMARQRLAWAKQMLNEMNGVSQEDHKPKVFQSFDQKFTKQEKQAFQKVLTEQQQDRIKLEAIKRRKAMMDEQKLKKLRKLNIIKDVAEAARIQQTGPQKKQQEGVQQQNQKE